MSKDKHAAFRRLAVARTSKILGQIRVLSNLSSSNYVYTQGEVDQIFNSIHTKLNDVRKMFDKEDET